MSLEPLSNGAITNRFSVECKYEVDAIFGYRTTRSDEYITFIGKGLPQVAAERVHEFADIQYQGGENGTGTILGTTALNIIGDLPA